MDWLFIVYALGGLIAFYTVGTLSSSCPVMAWR
jgi:hypothetical protein